MRASLESELQRLKEVAVESQARLNELSASATQRLEAAARDVACLSAELASADARATRAEAMAMAASAAGISSSPAIGGADPSLLVPGPSPQGSAAPGPSKAPLSAAPHTFMQGHWSAPDFLGRG
jgi:hypothetical protein